MSLKQKNHHLHYKIFLLTMNGIAFVLFQFTGYVQIPTVSAQLQHTRQLRVNATRPKSIADALGGLFHIYDQYTNNDGINGKKNPYDTAEMTVTGGDGLADDAAPDFSAHRRERAMQDATDEYGGDYYDRDTEITEDVTPIIGGLWQIGIAKGLPFPRDTINPQVLPCTPADACFIPTDGSSETLIFYPPYQFMADETFNDCVRMLVTDTVVADSRFSVYDKDVFIGETSIPSQPPPSSFCIRDPTNCFNSPRYSSGEFFFVSGFHAIRIVQINGEGGIVAFKFDTGCPEPSGSPVTMPSLEPPMTGDVPSVVPSIETMPSFTPTASGVPSVAPGSTLHPTTSVLTSKPTLPSLEPSMPGDVPSVVPSIETMWSITPTESVVPTTSVLTSKPTLPSPLPSMPGDVPSVVPSIKTMPSITPNESVVPTTSVLTSKPTLPSLQPSMPGDVPSVSPESTLHPTTSVLTSKPTTASPSVIPSTIPASPSTSKPTLPKTLPHLQCLELVKADCDCGPLLDGNYPRVCLYSVSIRQCNAPSLSYVRSIFSLFFQYCSQLSEVTSSAPSTIPSEEPSSALSRLPSHLPSEIPSFASSTTASPSVYLNPLLECLKLVRAECECGPLLDGNIISARNCTDSVSMVQCYDPNISNELAESINEIIFIFFEGDCLYFTEAPYSKFEVPSASPSTSKPTLPKPLPRLQCLELVNAECDCGPLLDGNIISARVCSNSVSIEQCYAPNLNYQRGTFMLFQEYCQQFTKAPSSAPSRIPSEQPSSAPSRLPSEIPSVAPSTTAPTFPPPLAPEKCLELVQFDCGCRPIIKGHEAPTILCTNAVTVEFCNAPNREYQQDVYDLFKSYCLGVSHVDSNAMKWKATDVGCLELVKFYCGCRPIRNGHSNATKCSSLTANESCDSPNEAFDKALYDSYASFCLSP